MSQTAAAVKRSLKPLIDKEKADFYPRFFKAGKGQYAEGDKFIGVTVPHQRTVAREFRELPRSEIKKLLHHAVHEYRLTGLLILVDQFQRAEEQERAAIAEFYLQHIDRVNNWDLVDSTAHKILGVWLIDRDRGVLDELADSGHLWSERASVIACLTFIKRNDFDDILRLAEKFLSHPHDLIHKAVGWMLREVGKADQVVMEAFLKAHYQQMPRTMLRYAIEKLPQPRRKMYLDGRV